MSPRPAAWLGGRRPAGGTLSLAASLLLASGCGGAPERPQRLVLVTLDTLRWDAFEGGVDGGGTPALGRLRELAKGALVFERHYASSSTTQPTHASLFTGLHPWEHGVVRNGVVLDAARPTLAEVLRDEGFWTAAFVASFPVTSRFGFDRGFQHFDEDFDRQYLEAWNEHAVDGARFYRLADATTDAVFAGLRSAPDGDQFLWVHYFDPHEPYGDTGRKVPARKQDLVKRIEAKGDAGPIKLDRVRALYYEDVAYLDERLSGLIEALLADERFETHVALTADHGESLGEGGVLGHGQFLSDAEVHVPLLLFSPRVEPGVRSDPCGSADVFATLIRLCGLEVPASSGRDLLASGSGETRPVLGMRRTFAGGGHTELLIDGTVAQLAGYHFYLLDGERTVRGNGDSVEVEGAKLDPAREQDVRRLFRTIEGAVEGLGSTELIDSETQRALESLGYAR